MHLDKEDGNLQVASSHQAASKHQVVACHIRAIRIQVEAFHSQVGASHKLLKGRHTSVTMVGSLQQERPYTKAFLVAADSNQVMEFLVTEAADHHEWVKVLAAYLVDFALALVYLGILIA